ncbi:MAG: AsmA family protein, partial [Alphaproteobacteria bacterium]|nr:AsmA family protein [Alphaproteobacteria bacterium]
MRKLSIVVGAVLALAVGALLVGPGFVDWNAYRPRIGAAVETAVGRKLSIEGDLKLTLLPSPALSVGQVRLANMVGAAEAEMVRLKALRVHLAVLPLLSGRLEIQSVALIEPVIELESLPDGRTNWHFDFGAGQAGTSAPPDVKLDRIAVENGVIVMRQPGREAPDRIENVSAILAADSLLGPFNAEGQAKYRGLPFTFSGTLGRFAPGQSTALSLRMKAADVELQASGSGKHVGDGPHWQGKIGARARDAAKLAAMLGWHGVSAELLRDLGLEATWSLTSAGLSINDVDLRQGDVRATAAVNIAFSPVMRADATLAMARLDLDRFLGGAKMGGPPSSTGIEWALDRRLPDVFAASLDVSVDAIAYGGGIVRQLRTNLTLNQGVLALNQLTAQLPGGSELSAIGQLAPGASGASSLRFNGAIELASENLRQVLDWLKIDVAAVPADRLRKVAVKANVAATAREI